MNQAKEDASDGFENNTGFESKKSDNEVKKGTNDAMDAMFGKDDGNKAPQQKSPMPKDDDAPKESSDGASKDSDEFQSFMSQI